MIGYRVSVCACMHGKEEATRIRGARGPTVKITEDKENES